MHFSCFYLSHQEGNKRNTNSLRERKRLDTKFSIKGSTRMWNGMEETWKESFLFISISLTNNSEIFSSFIVYLWKSFHAILQVIDFRRNSNALKRDDASERARLLQTSTKAIIILPTSFRVLCKFNADKHKN